MPCTFEHDAVPGQPRSKACLATTRKSLIDGGKPSRADAGPGRGPCRSTVQRERVRATTYFAPVVLVRGAIALGGNHRLKNAMLLAAFASLRDPESKTFYDRKRAEVLRAISTTPH
jgi:hypothetical protein